jgi:hypothetical protein
VRRIELELGVAPSHYEPRDPAAVGDGAQGGGRALSRGAAEEPPEGQERPEQEAVPL